LRQGDRILKKSAEMFVAILIIMGLWYILAANVKNQMLPTPWEAVS